MWKHPNNYSLHEKYFLAMFELRTIFIDIAANVAPITLSGNVVRYDKHDAMYFCLSEVRVTLCFAYVSKFSHICFFFAKLSLSLWPQQSNALPLHLVIECATHEIRQQSVGNYIDVSALFAYSMLILILFVDMWMDTTENRSFRSYLEIWKASSVSYMVKLNIDLKLRSKVHTWGSCLIYSVRLGKWYCTWNYSTQVS